MNGPRTTVEVFADVCCPFTYVGLRRFVEVREQLGRHDVVLNVRSWPLEVVNGEPLDPQFVAEEVDEIRRAVAPELFHGFAPEHFPSTSLPALTLAAAAYRRSPATGETVSLELRELLFEQGVDISTATALDEVAQRHGLRIEEADRETVHADLAEGRDRGVIGSPHFFTPAGGFFCPALEVARDDRGRLRVVADQEGFDAFIRSCLA